MIVVSSMLVLASVPSVANATSNPEVAGWIPYWQDTLGTKDARKHISDIDTLHPFVFSVKTDGTLADLGDIEDSKWERLFSDARKRDVEVIPTVMWSDGTQTHTILSDANARAKHIEAIIDMVDEGNFDGVDIDYEAKFARTSQYFSLFLKELKEELGSRKTLTCTIEPRTPPESLYREIPATLEYANDYKVIAEYCDRVEIMAYDQQRADIMLNDVRKGEPYMPVADIDWVRKVVEFALKDIPAEKIMLGVSTYGYHYMVNVSPNWYRSYERIGALNLPDIKDISDDYDVKAGRLVGGELSYSYFPDSSIFKILNVLPTPEGTRKGNEAAAKALFFANATGMDVQVRIVTYSDVQSIKDKVDLAKELGLRGVALFKIDGEEDKDIWDLF